MLYDRYSGVLAPLSALPSPFGIGTLGPETKQFIHLLREAGFSYWQMLPLTMVDAYNSPYKSYSAFAGNPIYIDPRNLAADGLLTAKEAESFQAPLQIGQGVAYRFAMKNAWTFLELAYQRMGSPLRRSLDEFIQKEKAWLRDYAIFTVARHHFDRLPWWEWPDEALSLHQEKALLSFEKAHHQEIDFLFFQQWAFQRQWQAMKRQANEWGLGLIGDLPIYVDDNSCDVWGHRELYQMKGSRLERVAGVPPDYFSADGQLWGNPLYRWSAHEKEDYQWWRLRLQYALERFDKIRIDHFRAFVNYWSVDAKAETAREGRWEDGPGELFFRQVLDQLPSERLFSEDLGAIDQKTREQLAHSGLPGMRVLQFDLNPWGAKLDLPHAYEEATVAYTGTHDNNTSLGWIWEMNEEERAFVLDYLDFPEERDWGKGGYRSPFCRTLAKRLWTTKAFLTVLPLQDICGFGSDTRMNTPGQAENNWLYRVPPQTLAEVDWAFFQRINQLYDRARPASETLHLH